MLLIILAVIFVIVEIANLGLNVYGLVLKNRIDGSDIITLSDDNAGMV